MSAYSAFYDILFLHHSNEEDAINGHELAILKDIDKIIDDSYDLNSHIPVLPDVFTELWGELNCEHTDFTIIAGILKKDAILKARLLTLVNSAYYKRNKTEITEIEKAIAMIGLETVSAIFTTFIVNDMVNFNKTHYQLFGKLVWQHLLETAVVSQKLAKYYKAENRFLCYLMGLVHDLGKVVIFRAKSNQWQRQIQLNHVGSTVFKRVLTQKSHDLARFIVEDWQLSEELIFSVSNYFNDHPIDPYSKVLKTANRISELNLSVEANILTMKAAEEVLVEEGLDVQVALECLKAVNNLPPI